MTSSKFLSFTLIFLTSSLCAFAQVTKELPRTPSSIAAIEVTAASGDIKAIYELGMLNINDKIGEYPSNVLRGMELLHAAAERGHAPAQFKLGYYFHTGPLSYENLKQEPEKAYFWYGKAAEQNHPEAQYELAMLYNPETGFRRYVDQEKYLYWLNKAAGQGHKAAIRALKNP
jgi:TPR repeat protein